MGRGQRWELEHCWVLKSRFLRSPVERESPVAPWGTFRKNSCEQRQLSCSSVTRSPTAASDGVHSMFTELGCAPQHEQARGGGGTGRDIHVCKSSRTRQRLPSHSCEQKVVTNSLPNHREDCPEAPGSPFYNWTGGDGGTRNPGCVRGASDSSWRVPACSAVVCVLPEEGAGLLLQKLRQSSASSSACCTQWSGFTEQHTPCCRKVGRARFPVEKLWKHLS